MCQTTPVSYTNSSSSLETLLQNKNRTLFNVLDTMPHNQTIIDNVVKAWSKINSTIYNRICCSVSGGSDSDLLVDICARCDVSNKVEYVWFDTGLEYVATKQHLDFLEQKYHITIIRRKAIKPIPLSCKEYGQPFLSKQVSEFMYRLQKYGFRWEDKPLDVLLKKYCKKADKKKAKQLEQDVAIGKSVKWVKVNGAWYYGCVSALMWWCNAKQEDGSKSMFNIERNTYLKEFLIQNPPPFKIANKCCKYAKKDVTHQLIKENAYDLMIIGVRKAEGGVRATAYKSCFSHYDNRCDEYRPIFHYSNEDKDEYNRHCGIENSQCYTVYGLCRTGCVGCPYGRNLEAELNVCEKYEPKLSRAVNNVFHDSYEYTKRYKNFQKEMKLKKKFQDTADKIGNEQLTLNL